MILCVYILKCRGGRYYVGSTSDLETRVRQHQQGLIPGWTVNRRPVTLVFSQEFALMREAVEAERQLKRWRRAKKEAVIEGRWDLLPHLLKTARSVDPSTSSG